MTQAVFKCRIIQKRWHASKIYEIICENKDLAGACRAGQFLQILCGEHIFLRRPISIHDTEGNNISFIFEIKGEGTLALSEKKAGDYLDILGPLGNGFSINQGDALILGGGIGIFPLLMVAKQKREKCDAVLGYRNEGVVVCNDRFDKICRETYITTDDGSFGIKGTVLDAAGGLVKRKKYKTIYACGPKPMLKAVKQLACENDIAAQISLEERMACGFGVCLSCGVKAQSDNEYGYTYKHICKHGPVFDAREVIL